MTEPKFNLPASIRQRLKNLSASQSVPFQEILQRYAIERFLCRLSQSDHAGKFVLKGAQMLVAWGSPRTRPTMDIDATCLRRGTAVTGLPAILRPESPVAANKQSQWSAFLRKSRIEHTPGDFSEIAAAIAVFLDAPISAVTSSQRPTMTMWTPPGPWR